MDYSRANEFGQGGEEVIEREKDKKVEWVAITVAVERSAKAEARVVTEECHAVRVQ